jgi:hypothetical protein
MLITAHFLGLSFYVVGQIELNWLEIEDNWISVNEISELVKIIIFKKSKFFLN